MLSKIKQTHKEKTNVFLETSRVVWDLPHKYRDNVKMAMD